ncbi:MAG: c-type cytochrome [Steroidobacteraceae bacterium]
MSKQDSHFFNVFSVVIGLLVAFTLAVFFLARSVGANTQNAAVVVDPLNVAAVDKRVAPPVRVAVAGADNSALKIEPIGPAAGAGPALAKPTDGKGVFDAACTACHGAGIAGAPKAGDKGAWGPRVAQGKDTLYKHAIQGFTGKAGIMPAKGGRADIDDDLIKAGVDYMLSL